MSIEFLPNGVKCNLKCTYCYQESMREAGNFSPPVNFIRAKELLRKQHRDFSLFGGEPLLTPLNQLEEVFQIGLEKHGINGVQTNGLLITDAHIDLFRRYRVHCGFSIDGPGILNSPRCPDAADTSAIIHNIHRTLQADVKCSMIVTIHRANASHPEELKNFVRRMVKSGMRSVNFHILELDYKAHEIALNTPENIAIFSELYTLSKEFDIEFHPFSDIKRQLLQLGGSDCIWNACDPLTTPAVHGIGADGELTNCGRVNKDGIDWAKAEGHGVERYRALALTPQEFGGCRGCKYFFACKGQCPGTAIDEDWRNKTRDCDFWYWMMSMIDSDLGLELNHFGLNQAALSGVFGTQIHLDSPHGDSHENVHGDHTDHG